MKLVLSIVAGISAFLLFFFYSKKFFDSDGETTAKDMIFRILIAFAAAVIVAFFVQM